jgi:MYXO-CTERM domain-containing protein
VKTRALFSSLLTLAAMAALAPPASATPTPSPTRRAAPWLEVATGLAPVRAGRALDATPPVEAKAAWARFAAEVGPGWEARWDAAAGTVATLAGRGLEAPGAAASPTAAEAFARDVLERHLALFAPGASIADFPLVADDLDGRLRTVAFAQHVAGLPVVDASIGFVFEGDRLVLVLSSALPRPSIDRPAPRASASSLKAAALAWVRSGAAVARVREVGAPTVLPLVDHDGLADARVVVPVTVDAEEPIGRFAVYVDARTARPVARRQLLHFAKGNVLVDAPVRYPESTRQPYAADDLTCSIAGASLETAPDGLVTWDGDAAASVGLGAVGPLVRVHNTAGADFAATLPLSGDGTVTWSAADDEFTDAQLTAYVHTMRAKRYVANVAPELSWLATQALVNVNIDDTCNAYSDGVSTNFFRAKGGCANTGRLADVITHEFGHSVHANSIIPGVGAFEQGLSEGIADYLASTIADDPGMGRGMFFSDQPLRDIDPPDTEYKWPDDIGEAHDTGRIISGALWDLRKALVAKLGKDAGVATSDHLWFEGIRRATDIPTMYGAVLVGDDDDGDLSNGTPNVCEIDAAFGPHGLRTVAVDPPKLAAEPPKAEGFTVTIKPFGLFAQCPTEAVGKSDLVWRLRGSETTSTIPMTKADDGTLTGTLPSQAVGKVIEYQVVVTLGDGTTRTFPDNLADPWYEMFVGEVIPLYCNDFEVNPFANGWSHAAESGPKSDDDWQWGAPGKAHGGGDPAAAWSGKKVIGNDLGNGANDGLYNANALRYAKSPVIDTKGHTHVRLQYRRWLNVEDGHFDHATIYGNDTALWTNFDSDNGDSSHTHHRDAEWRFHDVDLSDVVKDGKVEVTFELSSDPGLELGGWTIDDFCVVAWDPPRVPKCGDGVVDPGEACDEGAKNSDSAKDACRTSCKKAACGDGVVDTGEACDDGNAKSGDGCEPDCTKTKEAPSDGGAGGSTSTAKEQDIVPLDRSVGGCGCRTTPRQSGAPAIALAALGCAAIVARRRRR